MRGRTPEAWRKVVMRSPLINDSVRVLLLYLADHMRANRMVSVPRKKMSTDLGRTERRITQRISAAHDAGFLDTVQAGYRGHTAVYQGLFPNGERGTGTSTLSSAETVPLSQRKRGTHGGPTTTTAKPLLRGTDRNGGSEESAEQVSAFVADSCSWHLSAPDEQCGNCERAS